jgi:hypothetical protein
MTAKELYDLDFFEWTARNAELLREGRFAEADIEHIAEELEDMGKRDRRELESRLELLLEHLLKWQMQPLLRGPSWSRTIAVQRSAIAKLLEEAPSLQPKIDLERCYAAAVKIASRETGFSRDRFPSACPFRLEQVLDDDYFPDPPAASEGG